MSTIPGEVQLCRCLANRAHCHTFFREYEEEARLHQEEERLCRERGDVDGLQLSLYNQGVSYRDRLKMLEAIERFKEQELVCRAGGHDEGLVNALAAQASVLLLIEVREKMAETRRRRTKVDNVPDEGEAGLTDPAQRERAVAMLDEVLGIAQQKGLRNAVDEIHKLKRME